MTRRGKWRRGWRLGVAALVVWLPAAARAGEPDALEQRPSSSAPIEVSELELDSLLDLEVSAATKSPVKIADVPIAVPAPIAPLLPRAGMR